MNMMAITVFLLTIADSYTNKIFMEENCGETISLDLMRSHWIRIKPSKRAYYSPNMNCVVSIESDPRKRMSVVFRTIEIEFEPNCGDDYLSLYDGNSTKSKRLQGLTYKICGSKSPPGYYVTTSNKLTVRFKSDSWSNKDGFHIIITSFHTGKCLEGEFQCNNGHCIPENLVCDGLNHCGDASEECELNVEAIWGVVGGVLIIAVIGICIATATRRRKREQMQRKRTLKMSSELANTSGSCYKLPVEMFASPVTRGYYMHSLGNNDPTRHCPEHGPTCKYCRQENYDIDVPPSNAEEEEDDTTGAACRKERSNSSLW